VPSEQEVFLESRILRKLLWIYHGCTVASVFGGRPGYCDGCHLDFYADPATKILKVFENNRKSTDKLMSKEELGIATTE
jgi:hypothetical protein